MIFLAPARHVPLVAFAPALALRTALQLGRGPREIDKMHVFSRVHAIKV